jgi:hypothetical protein
MLNLEVVRCTQDICIVKISIEESRSISLKKSDLAREGHGRAIS